MIKARILVVDDELSMREFLSILLEREGYDAVVAESAEAALAEMDLSQFDLVISDVNMPGLSGLELLSHIKERSPETAVLLITAYSTAERAVEAMKLGAYDYIAKPFKVEEIKVLVGKALDQRMLRAENRRLHLEVEGRYAFNGLIGKSRPMGELFSIIEKVARSTSTVLLTGESGTGKELVARAIHYNSPRRRARFVAINCGAIPATLIESELFGHQRGAFTGAVADRPGHFEQADGGTLFLDEVSEVPLLLQPKLLRVIQEREVRRVGAGTDQKVDVRIIAATNRDLAQMVREGGFREDLYFRLNVVDVSLPPLRERVEDIPLLIEHFLKKFGCNPPSEPVSPEAMQQLLSYEFPGNVRELENLVERAVALGGCSITLDSLPPSIVAPQSPDRDPAAPILPPDGMDLEGHLNAIERRLLAQALESAGGVKKRAAELLGLTFRSFRYRLSKFGMDDE